MYTIFIHGCKSHVLHDRGFTRIKCFFFSFFFFFYYLSTRTHANARTRKREKTLNYDPMD